MHRGLLRPHPSFPANLVEALRTLLPLPVTKEVTAGSNSQSMVSGTTYNITITFDEALSGMPDAVVVTPRINEDLPTDCFFWFIKSYTSTQAIVRAKQNTGSTKTVYFDAVAMKA